MQRWYILLHTFFKIYNCYDFKGPLDRTYFPFNALLNHKCFFDLVIKLSRHREDNIPFFVSIHKLLYYFNVSISIKIQN